MSSEADTAEGRAGWVALGAATLFAGFIIGSAIAYTSANGYIRMLERMQDHYRTKFEYYFSGANERGYIELCRGADGEVDVLFKDECRS